MNFGLVVVLLATPSWLFLWWQAVTHRRLMAALQSNMKLREAEGVLLDILASTLAHAADFGAEEGVAWLNAEVQGESWRRVRRLMAKADEWADQAY